MERPAALSTNIARVLLLPAELKLIRHHPSPFFDLLFIQRVELIGAALAYGLANLAVHCQYAQAFGEDNRVPLPPFRLQHPLHRLRKRHHPAPPKRITC